MTVPEVCELDHDLFSMNTGRHRIDFMLSASRSTARSFSYWGHFVYVARSVIVSSASTKLVMPTIRSTAELGSPEFGTWLVEPELTPEVKLVDETRLMMSFLGSDDFASGGGAVVGPAAGAAAAAGAAGVAVVVFAGAVVAVVLGRCFTTVFIHPSFLCSSILALRILGR